MAISTKTLCLKPDGTVVPTGFFAANAVAINEVVTGGGGGGGGSGADGREVELRDNGTHLQWRYVGDSSWTNLKLWDDLKGTAGTNGNDGLDGSTWRSGSGVPDNAVGRDGDYYFRETTGDVYKRNGGAYGIVANLKGADGSDSPAMSFYHGSVTLNGATTAGSSASPASIEVDCHSYGAGSEGTLSFTCGDSVVFLVASGDAADGSIWINVAGLSDAAALAAALITAVNAGSYGFTASAGISDTVVLTSVSTGAAINLSGSTTIANVSVSPGSSYGTDGESASGANLDGTLAPAVTGKRTQLIALYSVGGLDVGVDITLGGVPLKSTFYATDTGGQQIQPDWSNLAAWCESRENAALFAECSALPAEVSGMAITFHAVVAYF